MTFAGDRAPRDVTKTITNHIVHWCCHGPVESENHIEGSKCFWFHLQNDIYWRMESECPCLHIRTGSLLLREHLPLTNFFCLDSSCSWLGPWLLFTSILNQWAHQSRWNAVNTGSISAPLLLGPYYSLVGRVLSNKTQNWVWLNWSICHLPVSMPVYEPPLLPCPWSQLSLAPCWLLQSCPIPNGKS